MGRKTLTISDVFLPMLFGKGEKHYEVTHDALPDDCKVVNVKLDFPLQHGTNSVTILLESSEWPETEETADYPRLDIRMSKIIPTKSWRDDPLL